MAKVTPVIEQVAVTPRERQTAACVAMAALGLVVISYAWNDTVLGAIASLPAALASAAIVMMLVTAAILRNQYRTTGNPSYAFLGTAYTSASLVLLPYGVVVLRMPSAAPFPPGSQGHIGAWLWMSWHAFFLIAIAIYAWADSFFERKDVRPDAARGIARCYSIGVTAVAALATLAISYYSEALPPMEGSHYAWLFQSLVEQLLAVCAVVLVVLVARTGLRHSKHLWTAVIVLVAACEIGIEGELLHHSFTIAWYAGQFAGVLSQSIMLVVLLRRTNQQFVAIAADNESLAEETLRDSLTGLRNRRGFDERLAQALHDAYSGGAPVALLALDLDYFKQYNDHFGHIAGDEALRAVAGAIEKITTRSRDIACRTGGEEFAVVLPFTDEAGARVVAQRLLQEVEQLGLNHAPSTGCQSVTISIGVAVSDVAIDAVELYARADQALYAAKRAGRNRLMVYSTSETTAIAV